MSTIDNDLRNSAGHNSIDYSEKDKIKLYDGIHKKRKFIKEISYNDLISKYRKIVDLAFAIAFSYTMNIEVLFF